MHPCCAVARRRSVSAHIMEWPWADEWPLAPEDTCFSSCEEHNQRQAPIPPDTGEPAHAQPYPNQSLPYPFYSPTAMEPPPPPGNIPIPKGETPRELKNKAEKQRRDKLTKSISELSKIVPPVLAMNRKVDKTSVLRLTAHYLRSHQYVFGDSLNTPNQFGESSIGALMSFLNGFIITTTYKGLVVVVSPNVQKYLGYSELELIGHNILNIIHEEDQQMMSNQLMPKSFLVGSNDEILFPEDSESKENVAEALASERRSFNVRFKKNGQRYQPHKYVNCHIQGSFRKSDRACLSNSRHYQMVRRLRTRCPNWCTSGNDVVFVGLVQPTYDTFETESKLDSCLMEYRTRHSIDGEIISCDSRISIATGYMANEVKGVNAMNFMHRDDVRWVIVALREMYDQHRLSGESCYRLMTKCGKFVYMRTKGFLEVDKDTGAVTSFVCINRVVDKVEGKQLNMEMKKKFMMLVNNTDETPPEDDDDDDDEEVYGSQGLPVEDPRQLQKVILHLVTNLPSPSPVPDTTQSHTPFQEERPPYRLSIIPPKKERIFHAIDKIYNVIECFKYSSKYLRYKKQKMSKRPPNEKSNPKKPKKRKKTHSESNSPTSNNENPIPDTFTSPNIEAYGFYPDLIPGTTTEISPQAGPSGLQRPIDPLLLRRLYDNESANNTENHTRVSNTNKDSIKTYAPMIPAIIGGKFCYNPSEVLEEHRYVQPLSPTPNVDINRQSLDTTNPLQSYEAPSATYMEESNISAPRDPGTGSHIPHTSSIPSSKSNNDYHNTSTVRQHIPPTYYSDYEYGYPQNWPAEFQPGPSRTSILPIQPPPLQYPPIQPTPLQHPPIQPPPLELPPIQLPPLQYPPIQPPPLQYQPTQPPLLQYPPIQPTPLQYPPIQLPPLQYPPIQPPPLQYQPTQPPLLQYPPIQPTPLQYPPIQPTPLQYPPIQPTPLQYPPIQPIPLQYSPIQPTPLEHFYIPSLPIPNYSMQPSLFPNYAVPSFTQNYPVLPSPIPPMPYPFNPLWQEVIPAYMGQFYQSEPYTEVRRNYTTESVVLPMTSQYVDTTDTSVYFQEEIIPQSTNITQEEIMECLEGLELPSDESFDDGFLDDLVRRHISQHIFPDDSTLEQQEQPLSVSQDPFVTHMGMGFELPTEMQNPISAEMPSTSNPSFASSSVVRAALAEQYNIDKSKTINVLLDEIDESYRASL